MGDPGGSVDLCVCLSCSDDEEVAPPSAKFADIYPLSNYDAAEVVAGMNGIHSELNGGGENMALKGEVHRGGACGRTGEGVWACRLHTELFKVPSGQQCQQQLLRR